MVRFGSWLKRNWTVVLLVVAAGYIVKISILGNLSFRQSSYKGGFVGDSIGMERTMPVAREVAPVENTDRLVVRDTSMSLQVKDVPEAINRIERLAVEKGGFLVDSSLSKPEGAASGNITVRVPENKRPEAMAEFRSLAVKVVSENVLGTDVTDQYVDNESRLEVLNKTKAKFEEIMARAVTVQDLLEVQRELINLQEQIDSLRGQQKYLEQTAKLTKITVYLSTDDLALPYTPDSSWRPAVVFKYAVRSLMVTLRKAGSLVIWLGVYSVVWVPIVGVGWMMKKRRRV